MIAMKLADSPGWAKPWDHTLDFGCQEGSAGSEDAKQVMSRHNKGEQPCHLHDVPTSPQ